MLMNALSVRLDKWILPIYFIIQLIIATIYGPHCTILTNFCLYLQVFSIKSFQFQ